MRVLPSRFFLGSTKKPIGFLVLLMGALAPVLALGQLVPVTRSPEPTAGRRPQVFLAQKDQVVFDSVKGRLEDWGLAATVTAQRLWPLHVERRKTSLGGVGGERIELRLLVLVDWVEVPYVVRASENVAGTVSVVDEDLEQLQVLLGHQSVMSRQGLEDLLADCHPALQLKLGELAPPYYSQSTGFKWDPQPLPGAIVHKAVAQLDTDNQCARATVDLVSGLIRCSERTTCRVE